MPEPGGRPPRRHDRIDDTVIAGISPNRPARPERFDTPATNAAALDGSHGGNHT